MSQSSQESKLNFYDNYLDSFDIDILKAQCDEKIDLFGFPCILYKYKETEVELDSFYGDAGSIILDNYNKKPTHFYSEYKNLQQILYSYGQTINRNTTFNGMMKFEDHPRNGDYVYFIRKFDDDIIKCEITNCALYKNICYLVDIAITMFDTKKAGNITNEY